MALARKQIEEEHAAKMAALERALRRQEWKRHRYALKAKRDAAILPIERQLDDIRQTTIEQTVSGRRVAAIVPATLPSLFQRLRLSGSNEAPPAAADLPLVIDPLDDADSVPAQGERDTAIGADEDAAVPHAVVRTSTVPLATASTVIQTQVEDKVGFAKDDDAAVCDITTKAPGTNINDNGDSWHEETNEKVYWDWDSNDMTLQRIIKPHNVSVSTNYGGASKERNLRQDRPTGICRQLPDGDADVTGLLARYHENHRSHQLTTTTVAAEGECSTPQRSTWSCEPRTARHTLEEIFHDDDVYDSMRADAKNGKHAWKSKNDHSCDTGRAGNPSYFDGLQSSFKEEMDGSIKDLLICSSGKLVAFYTKLSLSAVHVLSERVVRVLQRPSFIGGMVRALTATFLMQESEALGNMLEQWTAAAFPPQVTAGERLASVLSSTPLHQFGIGGFDAMAALIIMRRSWATAWHAAEAPVGIELTAPGVTKYEQQELLKQQHYSRDSTSVYQRIESPFELLTQLEFHFTAATASTDDVFPHPAVGSDHNINTTAPWLFLLPNDCVRRYATLCRALIYWRWLDHLSSMLWSASASKGAMAAQKGPRRRWGGAAATSASDPPSGKGGGGIAAVPEVWLFASTVRAVIQPVMQHMWHGVSTLSDAFRSKSHVIVSSSSRSSRESSHRSRLSEGDDAFLLGYEETDGEGITMRKSSATASSTVALLKDAHETFLSTCFSVCLLSPEFLKARGALQSMARRVDDVNRLLQWSSTTYALEAADRAAIAKMRSDFLVDAFKFTQALRSSAAAEDPKFSNFLSTLQHVVAQCRRR